MFPLGHARVNFGNEVNFRSFSGLKNLIKCVFLILLRELMHHPLYQTLPTQLGYCIKPNCTMNFVFVNKTIKLVKFGVSH